MALGDWWDTSAYFNSDPEYGGVRTSDSVTTNAIDSMQSIDNSSGSGWSGFWSDFGKGALSSVLNYSLAKDMAQTQAGLAQQQVRSQAQIAATQATVQRQQGVVTITPGMLMLGAFGVLAFIALKK